MDLPEEGGSKAQGDQNRNQAVKKDARPGPHPFWRRQKFLILGSVAIIVLALALGLGLGLGLRRKHDDDAPTTHLPPASASPSGAAWQPAVNSSWQIILSYPLDIDGDSPSVEPDVGIFDIDLFLHQNSTVIDSLHKLGKKVICYFSAGSYEPGRPDSSRFNDSDLGKELDGWPGEFWLNISSPNVRDIMVDRIELASNVGCDAVDPDNVDGYQNENGLKLTAEDSVSFVKFLAAESSKRGLGVGLKNAADIIPDVLSVVQFCVNEECAEYDECDTFSAFVEAGKPVFHIEYPPGAPGKVSKDAVSDACSAAGATGFSTVIKTMDLDGWVEFCDGQTADTAVVKDE